MHGQQNIKNYVHFIITSITRIKSQIYLFRIMYFFSSDVNQTYVKK